MNRSALWAAMAVVAGALILGGIFLLGGDRGEQAPVSAGAIVATEEPADALAAEVLDYEADAETVPATLVTDAVDESEASAIASPSAVVSGRVLDRDGEPIPGAVVRLFDRQEATGGLDRSGESHNETISAADGTYELRSARRVWRYILEANAEGYGTNGDVITRENWNVPDPIRATRDIVLAPSATLSGRVVDEAGEPVEGMLVMTSPIGGDPGEESPRAFGHEEVTSDADGRFAFATASEGMRYTVGVEPEERWAPMHVLTEAPDEEIVLELSETGAVFAGIVVEHETERLIADAVVTLATVSRGSRPFSNAGYPTYTTGSDGAFHFERIGAGTYRVTASSDRYPLMDEDASRNLRAELRIGDVAPAAEIVLRGGFTIRGVVLERNEERPIEGARVTFDRQSDAWDYSDAEGRFELMLSSRGLYRIRAEKEGYAPSGELWSPDITVNSSDPDSILEEYTLHLRPGVTVRGTVTDEHGHPVEGVNLSRYALGESLSFQNATNAAGEYEISLPIMSEGQLSASHGGRMRGAYPSLRVRREPLEGIDIQFLPEGVIEASVRDSDGKPVEGAWLSYQARHAEGINVYVMGQHVYPRNNSNEEGRFDSVHLAVGSYAMFNAGHPELGESPQVTREIRASGNEPVELVFGEHREIRLHLTDAETGEPVTDAAFHVISRQAGVGRRQSLAPQRQEQGTYTLRIVSEAEVGIRVAAEGYAEKNVPLADREQTDYHVALEHEEKPVLLVYVRDAETREPVRDLELLRWGHWPPTQHFEADPEAPGLLVMNPFESNYRGLVTAPGYERGEIMQHTLRIVNEEEFLIEGEVLLRRAGDFTGTVVDAETGDPVGDVVVSVHTARGVTLNMVSNDPVHSTTTDDDGTFALRPVSASQNRLRFVPPSPYVEFERVVVAPDTRSNDLGTIELDKQADIEVRLVAEGNAPTVGVPILLRQPGSAVGFRLGSPITPGRPTDGEGRVTFEDVNQRHVTVAGEALTHSMDALAKPEESIEFPVGTAEIEVLVDLPEQSHIYSTTRLQAVRTSPLPRLVSAMNQSQEGDEGATIFMTGPIPSGTWQLQPIGNFGDAHQRLWNREVTVGPGETERIDLTRDEHVVTGRVVFEDGGPLPPERVVGAVMGRSVDSGEGWTVSRDGENGGFRVAGLEPGEHRVMAHFLDDSEDPPVELRSDEVVFALSEGRNHDLGDLVLRPRGGDAELIIHAVNSQNGEPVGGLPVTLSIRDSGAELARRSTDDEGRVTFRALEPGDYRLWWSGNRWLTPDLTLTVEGGTPTEHQLALDPASQIMLEVRRADGLPPTAPQADLRPLELDYPTEAEPRLMHSSSRNLVYSGVVPGLWEVRVRDADGSEGQAIARVDHAGATAMQANTVEVLLE